MLRHHWRLCAAAAAAATKAGELASMSPSKPSPSLPQAVESVAPMPVFLKPASSPRRKASFYFPRMRETSTPDYTFRPSVLGAALPLFSITSSSCEYYALRLPLLKAGFRRVPAEARDVASNLLWGRSMPFCEMLRDGQPAPSLHFPPAAPADQAAYLEKLRMVRSQQRYNHFPLSHANLGCKRGMAANVRRAFTDAMKFAATPAEREAVQARYNYVPRTWFYPQERESLVAAMKAAPSDRHFIWKPSRGSCGRGILISQGGTKHAPSWQRIMEDIECKAASKETRRLFSSYVVQEYIEDPLLIEGRKMDLRLYVAVTSYNPLTVYWHEEGLVRFAAEPYTDAASAPSSRVELRKTNRGDNEAFENRASELLPKQCTAHMLDRFRHLTNYSVGRRYIAMQHHGRAEVTLSPEATSADGDAGLTESAAATPELKWPLQRLWSCIDACSEGSATQAAGVIPARRPSDAVREEIAQLISRTLFAVRPIINDAVRRVSMPGGYFELYGFDVMLDASLHPYLIEVNTLPSLESSSTLDYSTKTNVVADLLNLAMLEPFERTMTPGSTLWNSSHLRENMSRSLGATERGLFHAAEAAATGLNACGHEEARAEVELRLKDELAYARGFHRIFPAKPLSDTSSQRIELPSSDSCSAASAFHQPLDTLATCSSYLADLHAYEAHGLLSDEDVWALAS
ncbi:hypothetical protein LSCM1_03846 [Leishmania martiniquensis]|uniref:ATP-grasp domain-containing protein n=1 Tax=Leishmania martiniquensis TaxID=1580590 RepID=A0A836KH06_9TRYP|nr:hypothetical protein LSCM1_03846 [Leishmania martiniquensis]